MHDTQLHDEDAPVYHNYNTSTAPISLLTSAVTTASNAPTATNDTMSPSSQINIHPNLNNRTKPFSSTSTSTNASGGTLRCLCPTSPVTIALTSNVAHNHFCGCSKCWKPAGALFSLVAVVPTTNLSITSNANKLQIVDPSAVIQRHACRDCGVHLFGRIEVDHAFKGLDFVHVELGEEKQGWQEPQFAGFVSSVIEQGFEAEKMGEVREGFERAGLKCYDVLSPGLMDLLAAHTAAKEKKAGRSKL